MSVTIDVAGKRDSLAIIPVQPCPECGRPRERVQRGNGFRPRCFSCYPVGRVRSAYNTAVLEAAVREGGTWREVTDRYNAATGESRKVVHLEQVAGRWGLVRGYVPEGSLRHSAGYRAYSEQADMQTAELEARVAAVRAFRAQLGRPMERADWRAFEAAEAVRGREGGAG